VGAITANTMMTLNGVAGRPEAWQFTYASPPMMRVIAESLQSSAGLLLGRRTYEEFAHYWPHIGPEENPMAPAMNGLPKFVVASTLAETSWENATLLPGAELASAIADLKVEVTGVLNIIGSPTLVRSLLDLGLLDRLDLMVYPLVAEEGIRLFDGATTRTGLSLVACSELPNGVLHLTYEPTGNAADDVRELDVR
jgi:dihydrofolate reductase